MKQIITIALLAVASCREPCKLRSGTIISKDITRARAGDIHYLKVSGYNQMTSESDCEKWIVVSPETYYTKEIGDIITDLPQQ